VQYRKRKKRERKKQVSDRKKSRIETEKIVKQYREKKIKSN